MIQLKYCCYVVKTTTNKSWSHSNTCCVYVGIYFCIIHYVMVLLCGCYVDVMVDCEVQCRTEDEPYYITHIVQLDGWLNMFLYVVPAAC